MKVFEWLILVAQHPNPIGIVALGERRRLLTMMLGAVCLDTVEEETYSRHPVQAGLQAAVGDRHDSGGVGYRDGT